MVITLSRGTLPNTANIANYSSFPNHSLSQTGFFLIPIHQSENYCNCVMEVGKLLLSRKEEGVHWRSYRPLNTFAVLYGAGDGVQSGLEPLNYEHTDTHRQGEHLPPAHECFLNQPHKQSKGEQSNKQASLWFCPISFWKPGEYCHKNAWVVSCDLTDGTCLINVSFSWVTSDTPPHYHDCNQQHTMAWLSEGQIDDMFHTKRGDRWNMTILNWTVVLAPQLSNCESVRYW